MTANKILCYQVIVLLTTPITEAVVSEGNIRLKTSVIHKIARRNAKETRNATILLGIQELVPENGIKRIKTRVFCKRTMETL